MGAIKQMMIEQGYFDEPEYMEEPQYYYFNNKVLMEDGRLLSDMRYNGMLDTDARLLLETYNLESYSDIEWEEVQYHADMLEEWKKADHFPPDR